MKFYRILHERSSCIGCGSCEYEAPQTWELDPVEGLSNLKEGVLKGNYFTREIDETDYEDNKRACDSCPINIIRLEEVRKNK